MIYPHSSLYLISLQTKMRMGCYRVLDKSTESSRSRLIKALQVKELSSVVSPKAVQLLFWYYPTLKLTLYLNIILIRSTLRLVLRATTNSAESLLFLPGFL